MQLKAAAGGEDRLRARRCCGRPFASRKRRDNSSACVNERCDSSSAAKRVTLDDAGAETRGM
jgi:hypothetical protein